MKRNLVVPALAVAALMLVSGLVCAQQALPTATQRLQLSAFGGFGAVFTGLASGRNIDVLAGADLGLTPIRGVRPVLEVRGAYPIARGDVDAQKSILGGARAEFLVTHRARPYADFLVGRGEVHYNGGYQFGNQIYLLSTTNVYSFGGGVDYDLTEHFAVRIDGQFQKWGYAPTISGNMYPKSVNALLVYRFGFGTRYRQ